LIDILGITARVDAVEFSGGGVLPLKRLTGVRGLSGSANVIQEYFCHVVWVPLRHRGRMRFRRSY
ncbi:MAG: hypothetical protein ACR2OU_13015, partial [Thermomicrobiales bacterium]